MMMKIMKMNMMMNTRKNNTYFGYDTNLAKYLIKRTDDFQTNLENIKGVFNLVVSKGNDLTDTDQISMFNTFMNNFHKFERILLEYRRAFEGMFREDYALRIKCKDNVIRYYNIDVSYDGNALRVKTPYLLSGKYISSYLISEEVTIALNDYQNQLVNSNTKAILKSRFTKGTICIVKRTMKSGGNNTCDCDHFLSSTEVEDVINSIYTFLQAGDNARKMTLSMVTTSARIVKDAGLVGCEFIVMPRTIKNMETFYKELM